MSEHHRSVAIKAPVQQVYNLFTHFNDFPKFMRFVKEVTYYDDQRSHWVAELAGTHEWDAVNEDWIEGQQIGWRATSGLENTGRIRFTDLGNQRTQIDVLISYKPPAGVLGEIVDWLGIDSRFDLELQKDLEHFAHMVEQAPAGALDPMQSHYLFHADSAVQQSKATERQEASMQSDPMMSQKALGQRATIVQHEEAQRQEMLRNQQAQREQQHHLEQQTAHEQAAILNRQATINQQEVQNQVAPDQRERPLDPVHDTIGGRNASMVRTAIGDQDGRSERYPNYQQDPMIARAPGQQTDSEQPALAGVELESPWRTSIQGQTLSDQQSEQASGTVQAPEHKEVPGQGRQVRKDEEQDRHPAS